MAAVAAEAQADPERHCAYLGENADSISIDIANVADADGGDWTDGAWVALDDDRDVVGWLLAETDSEIGRIWWWGPVVADTTRLPIGLRDGTMDQLFRAASSTLDALSEHELAVDDRSETMRSFGRRNGFVAEEASAMLRTAPFAADSWTGDDKVIALNDRHHASVIELHDTLFPNTHTPGPKLVEAIDDVRLVVERGDDESGQRVAGYVAVEAQTDGSLYIDFLGVAHDRRGLGVGRRLVSEAMRLGELGGATHAHLTVRVGNTAARRLYSSLGFVEESVLLPLRRGFSLS